MKRSNTMKLRIKPIVAACALAMAAGQAGALDVYLAAKPYLKNLPDGSSVPMWGYVLDADTNGNGRGDCWQAADNATRQACIMALQDPTIPGPRITLPVGDSDLRIFLSNGLPEPTSIVIPGQKLPFSRNNNGPTWIRPNNATNPIAVRSTRANRTHKMRSYGREALENGGRQRYFWTTALTGSQSVPNPIEGSGTLIYHTGTHPQKQLYMGLYGTVAKDAAAAEVYPGVSYASDTTLFYSDIDPEFNRSVVSDPTYDQTPYAPNDYTLTHSPLVTAIRRHPRWFLINGQPYQPGPGGTPDIAGLATNQPNLIRFASATTEKHVPVLQGLYGAIHGEDGIQYNWQEIVNGVTASTPAPIQQYSIGLPPLKTKDVIVNPTIAGRYAVYDGNGYMTNPSDPGNEVVGDSVGGMLRFISFAQGANQPPITVPDQLEITIPEIATGPVLADIDVLANDVDPENAALGVLDTTAQFTDTNLVIDWSCSSTTDNCTVTATATDPWISPVVNDFTYTATDNNASTTDTAGTVTVTVVQNMAPVPADDILAAVTDAPTNFNLYTDLVLPNDTDADNDILSVAAVDVNTLTDLDAGVVECLDLVGGDCTYTPPNPIPPTTTVPFSKIFTYTVSDGVNPESAPVTVTINVNLPGNPALALDDTYATDEDTLLSVPLPGVLGNDTDSLGGVLGGTETAVLVAGSGPANAANFVLNSDGSFDYEPAADFNGQDSFQYMVNNGVDSLPATVTIDVAAVNDPPVGVGESYTVVEDGILRIPAPGVLENDSDADGDPLTANLLTPPVSALPGPCPFVPAGTSCFVLNADGSFLYQPDVNFNGIDTFTYEVSDGTLVSAPVMVTIAVTPQNDAPLAVNDSFYLTSPTEIVTDGEGQPLTATFDFPAPGVLGNDIDDTALTAMEVNDTDGVPPSVTSDGATSVTIDNNGVGALATLEYTATDTTNLVSNIATADFIRLVTISRAEYRLNEDNDPTNDDWRIRGRVDTTVIPPGSQVHAFLVRADETETEIVSNMTGNNTGAVLNNGDFRINTNNLGPQAAPGDSIRVEVRHAPGEPLAGDVIENATYGLMPVYILP